ncbi:molybdopterin-containing oxidoreductase family protein [Actinomadura macra]|uniref:molybdopterin-containing oxidoreductase family protein n=1 Tax=Actinomadura macra TaxID=46164 RepID=UPI000AC90BDA|nr:molybdopterin-dependent oxidoreductase [Actinomadura macra]
MRDDSGVIDFRDQSAALTPDRVVRTSCQFCNANCGLHVDLKAGRVIGIRGERRDRVQRGNICVKADMMADLAYSPHRLTRPLRRTSGAKGSADSVFEAISWDSALDLIAERLLGLRDEGNAHTIANRTTGRLPRGVDALVGRLFALLGSPNNTDVGPVCNDAGADALRATFGLGNFTNGYGRDEATGKEDLGSSRYLLFFGTNQAETHPVTFDYLLRARERTGARLVVVDPRLTPTGAEADQWIAPKPHTDLALVLGMLHHILAENLYDHAFVERWVLGFRELREHVREQGYDPGWAAAVTGVPEAEIRRIAVDYATMKPAAIFCNAGVSHQLSAFDTYRVICFLAAVTGNIGRLGGGCNFMHNTWPGELRLPQLTGPLPERPLALPVGPDSFASSILTGEPYRLRAVITEGNPLLASANTERVKGAFAELDFFVYTGLFMEEAAYYADVILPVCSGLELDGVYMRRDDRAIRWQERALAPVGDSRPDWQIWIDLAHALARADQHRPSTYWTDAFPEEWKEYRTLWSQFVAHTPGMAGMSAERMKARTEPLRWPCPSPRHPGVSALFLDHQSWYEAAASLGHPRKRFLTPSGKVEIHTETLDRELASAGHAALPVFYTHPEVTGSNPTIAYEPGFIPNPLHPGAVTRKVRIGVPSDAEVHDRYPLMGMTGRPSVVHFASVTHWTDAGKRINGIRFVQIHPTLARRLNIADHDPVLVETPRGAITGTALLWEGIREDTIFIPHGFGPAQVVGDVTRAPRYKATNTLSDDRYYDNLSGQLAYKCFACRVSRAT